MAAPTARLACLQTPPLGVSRLVEQPERDAVRCLAPSSRTGAPHPPSPVTVPEREPDTAGEIGSGGERGEARGAGGGTRDGPEPVAQAAEVDRGRGRHVLQVGPGQPAVASPAQPEGADALREGALDAGPPGVAAAARLGRELPARRLERLVLGPWRQLQVPRLVRLARARRPRRAAVAVGLPEQDADVPAAGPVGALAPARGQLAPRAAGPPAFPVDLEPLEGEGALDPGLPRRVRASRADQVDAVVLAAAHQQPGVDVGGIDQVLARRQALSGQEWIPERGATGQAKRIWTSL